MKSLIHKWSKKTKGKGKGSTGGSDNGSREASSESARLGQRTAVNGSPAANIYPSMEAKDFGKVSSPPLLSSGLTSRKLCTAQILAQCDDGSLSTHQNACVAEKISLSSTHAVLG